MECMKKVRIAQMLWVKLAFVPAVFIIVERETKMIISRHQLAAATVKVTVTPAQIVYLRVVKFKR